MGKYERRKGRRKRLTGFSISWEEALRVHIA